MPLALIPFTVTGLAIALYFASPVAAGPILDRAEIAEFDPYGGWRLLHIQDGTGFFEVAEHNGRRWLVTPEGNAFFMLGINHLNWDLVLKYGLEGDYGGEPSVWARTILEEFDQAGLNTIGHTVGYQARRLLLRNNEETPKTEEIYFVNRFSSDLDWRYPDVFDSTGFWDHCQQVLDGAAILPDDPRLIGYYTSEEVEFGDGYAPGPHGNSWPIKLADQDPGTPGKTEFVTLMRSRYGDDIVAFDGVWGGTVGGWPVHFGDWNDVEQFTDYRRLDSTDPEQRDQDELAFAIRIAEVYYPTVERAIRERDPNHLILGSRFTAAWNNMPCEVLQVAAQHSDVISVIAFDLAKPRGQEQLQLAYDCSGLPIIVADTKFVVPTEDIPNPFGFIVPSHPMRGVGYRRLLRNEALKAWVVGFNWCNYLDNIRDANQGLRDRYNMEYWPWIADFAAIDDSVYVIHSGRAGRSHMRE